jgi:hypothetical protein
MSGEQYHGHTGTAALDFHGQFAPVHARHFVIGHYHGHQVLPEQLECFRPTFGKQDAISVTFENPLIELSGREVIVDTKQLRGTARC